MAGLCKGRDDYYHLHAMLLQGKNWMTLWQNEPSLANIRIATP